MSLNLEKVKVSLLKRGYEFCRDGGFLKESEPFMFCNYLFYYYPETKARIRIWYNYPMVGEKDVIFEVCYAKDGDEWWTDVVPNFSRNEWREVSDWYEEAGDGKFVRKADIVK